MAYIYLLDKRKRTAVKRFSINTFLFALLLMCGAGLLVRSNPATTLEQVRSTGELRVLSRSGPISYYQGAEGNTGFEFTLLQGFAQELGVKLVIQEDVTSAKLLQPTESSPFDIASPTVINTQITKEQFHYSSAFMTLDLHLIYNNSQNAPTSISQLDGKRVLVVNNASLPVPLQELQHSLPNIRWELVDHLEMADLLDLIERGHADYAVVDSAVFAMHHAEYPHAQIAFNLGTPHPLSWAFLPSRDTSLYEAAQAYLAKVKANGQLARISAQFFDQSFEVNSNDAQMFSQRLVNRFPLWEGAIKAAATEYALDWQLVAAVGYQESHWIPNAESPTGVRGFMMLTPNTAKELGVQKPNDPIQSIFGGAKYLRYLLDSLPPSITGENRLYMALAAYNQGIGHLDDARSLTRKLKGDANDWNDVSRAFLLLTKPEYYNKATYGFARGGESVAYVKNVLNYQKIMAYKEHQEQLRIATSNNTSDELDFNNTTQEKSALVKLSKIRLSSASSLSFL